MNLNDFGTNSPQRPSSGFHRTQGDPKARKSDLRRWQMRGRMFEVCGKTRRQLPAGAYVCRCRPMEEHVCFFHKELEVDDLIDFVGTLPSEILTEIEAFWSLGEKFIQRGYLHRRGYLLYGPAGSGKSSIVHQVIRQVCEAGHVAVFCEEPEVFVRAMEQFRSIEPERPVVCVFEDIDSLIENHGDSDLLQWLDGSRQIGKVVNLATTNYPEKLDRRIICRPRRFDRILKIEAPDANLRRAYFAKKMPELTLTDLERWVKETRGLSFAALAELVISVACLGHSLEDAVSTLRTLEDQPPSSREFDGAAMGFAVERNGD